MRCPNQTIPALVALVLTATNVAAQDACKPGQVTAAIDAYAAAPFSARAWRVLNGLGDPGAAGESYAYSSWQQQEEWTALVKELAPESQALQNPGYDCRMGYPLATLKGHVAQLGKSDPYIGQWLKVQELVTKACSNVAVSASEMPPPADVKSELAETQQHDRAYQEASVLFYSAKQEAVQKFRTIAASNSPHRAAARYNIANLLANANNVVEARKEADAIMSDPTLASVHEITRELLGYIANIEDTAQGWTALLDDTVAVLNQPAAEISASLEKRVAYEKALYDIDYAGVRAKRDDWWIAGTLPENPTISKAIVDTSRKHPMALWMMTGQSVNEMYGRAPWPLVGKAWSGWSASYVDRALALSPAGQGIKGPALDVLTALKAVPDDTSRAALWQKARAAVAVAASSCGTAPETGAASELVMQATRLAALAGKYDEAYGVLSSLPIQSSTAYVQFILPKLMQHVLATGDAAEGRRLRDRLLTKSFFDGMSEEQKSSQGWLYSDYLTWVAEDEGKFVEALVMSNSKLSSPVLNMVSTQALMRLSGMEALSVEQKALLARAAWTREYATGKLPKPDVTASMLALNPQLKAAFDKVKTEFPKLREDRQWLLTVLRNPRFGILVNTPDWSDPLETPREDFAALDSYDHNDKNWWCPLQQDRHLAAIRAGFDEDSGLGLVNGKWASKAVLPLLDEGALAKAEKARDGLLKSHPLVKAADWKKLRALANAPSAPRKLSEAAIAWGKASKGDDGAPEALALAVRATRYGCSWAGGHKAYSKPAQELLKAKFGQTSWATATPYWFDCMRQEWDKDYNKIATCKPYPWPKQAPLN